MKTLFQFGPLLSLLLLASCDEGPERSITPITPSSPPRITSVYPDAGAAGEEVTLLIENFPESAVYQMNVLPGTYPEESQTGPYVTVLFGAMSADVVSTTHFAIVARIPQHLDPGDYEIRAYINGHTVVYDEALFKVVDRRF